MSKEVKRFTIGTFHAAIVSAGSECVLASDYEALLAERDRMLTVMKEARQVIAIALRANAPDWYATDEEINQHMTIKKLDAALQGEQK